MYTQKFSRTFLKALSSRSKNLSPKRTTSFNEAKCSSKYPAKQFPRKDDVVIAKNYLNENELLALNNLVEQYLIFAEGQAMRRISMKMQDWIEKLDGFLKLNDRDILQNAGKISHEMAKEIAEQEYEKFNRNRIADEDEFEKAIEVVEKNKKLKKPKK